MPEKPVWFGPGKSELEKRYEARRKLPLPKVDLSRPAKLLRKPDDAE